MDFTPEDIERIAELASLELSGEEKRTFVPQFQEILGYFQKIQQVELGAAEMMLHPEEAGPHWRDDEPEQSGVAPDSFSPYLEHGHFKVPRVIE